MFTVAVVASEHAEAGIIDAGRLSDQIKVLEAAGLRVEVLRDPSQWALEKHLLKGSADLYFPLTIHAFEAAKRGVRRRAYNIPMTLERHDAPFVGSAALVQTLVRDKVVVTRQSGIALPTEIVSRGQIEHSKATLREGSADELVIVKPNDMTSSIGITSESVVRRRDALEQARRIFDAVPLTEDVLVQAYCASAREFTVSVLGNGAEALTSVLELAPVGANERHMVYTQSEKEKTPAARAVRYRTCDDADIRHALTFHARRFFDWFNLRDFARFDFIYADRPYLIDVNALPVLGQSFGLELRERYELPYENLMAVLVCTAAARYAASGRTLGIPDALASLVPLEISAALSASPPINAVPESSVASPFKPTTARYTMVDRVGAETDVLYFLKALVHLIKPLCILETGTYKGATAAAMGGALLECGAGRLTTLEKDPAFARAAKRALHALPVDVIETSSLDYTPDQPVDLLFLDSHRPLRVQEFRRFKPHLSEHALIIWHDSAPEHATVHKDIGQLVDAGEIDAVLLPTPRGITLSKLRSGTGWSLI